MTRSRFAVSFGESLDLDLVVGEGAPPATQALVVAQDVHLILGEVTQIEDTRETPQELLATAGPERPRRRGSLVVAPPRRGEPLVLQAVIYDFEDSPPAREVHVFEALLAAFEESRTRGLRSLALHPLGTAHAGLEPERFLGILGQVCFSAAEMGTSLRHVHLMLASPDELGRYETLLKALLGR